MKHSSKKQAHLHFTVFAHITTSRTFRCIMKHNYFSKTASSSFPDFESHDILSHYEDLVYLLF